MDRYRWYLALWAGGLSPGGYPGGPNGKNKKAVKVWDKRDFKNLDD